jgi:hypothetical protein
VYSKPMLLYRDNDGSLGVNSGTIVTKSSKKEQHHTHGPSDCPTPSQRTAWNVVFAGCDATYEVYAIFRIRDQSPFVNLAF